jgi:hypothetical protein
MKGCVPAGQEPMNKKRLYARGARSLATFMKLGQEEAVLLPDQWKT